MTAKTSSVASRRRVTWGTAAPGARCGRAEARSGGAPMVCPSAAPGTGRAWAPPAPAGSAGRAPGSAAPSPPSPSALAHRPPQEFPPERGRLGRAPGESPDRPVPCPPRAPGKHGRSGHHPPVRPPRHRLRSAPRGEILPARGRFRKRSVGSSRAAQRRETAFVRRPAIPRAWTSTSTFRVLPVPGGLRHHGQQGPLRAPWLPHAGDVAAPAQRGDRPRAGTHAWAPAQPRWPPERCAAALAGAALPAGQRAPGRPATCAGAQGVPAYDQRSAASFRPGVVHPEGERPWSRPASPGPSGPGKFTPPSGTLARVESPGGASGGN